MTGPSAMGSENGTPSSIRSAPAAVNARISGTVCASEGSPTVMYGISAARPAARSLAKVASIRLIGREPHHADAKAPATSTSRPRRLVPLGEWLSSPRRIALGPTEKFEPAAFGNRVHVLVAAPRKIDQQHRFFRQSGRDLGRVGESVRRFERGNDALDAAAFAKSDQRLIVGDRDILRAPVVLEPCMLGAHARLVEPRRHRMRFDDLTVLVLQQIGSIAVQDAGPARGQ